MVLYPMFVHMYLELVYKGSEKEGKVFFIMIILRAHSCNVSS